MAASVERSLEAWEEMQRHGQDLADRFTQGFTGLIHSTHISPPPSFTLWSSNLPSPKKIFQPRSDHIEFPSSKSLDHVSSAVSYGSKVGFSAIFDIGDRLGEVGAEFGAGLNAIVGHLFQHVTLPMIFGGLGATRVGVGGDGLGTRRREEEVGTLELTVENHGYEDFEDKDDAHDFIFDPKSYGFGKTQGSINITSTYDSRTCDIESSLVARGDIWRAEASHGSAVSGSQQSPLFLVQLGPVLFVRDTTLLLPVHLSKQHLLWYGYDRKNGVHSLCPAIWSKHRRWLSMSMISLNPLTCSFLDVQFPNGQVTYVAGEGLATSAFLPVLNGLLQVQGQYPGETRFSFSYKNKWGTHITPTVQWPDKSFTLGVAQALAWERSGLLYRPTFQFSISPTVGGSEPGIRAEFIHSLREKLSVICGYACTVHPSAYASVALGRSKWNGHVGSSGVVIRVETPMSNVSRPSFSIQLNTGVDF